jgi:hypothetical protein
MIAVPNGARKRVLVFIVFYILAYVIASYLDLATTSLGLQRPGVSEKNVFATTAQGYSTKRAWIITAGGAVIMTACILFAVRHSASVEERWLHHPIRSFGKFYLNPWSKSAITVSPLHMLSLVIAFALLRVLAAANNLSVYWFGFGPMGALMKGLAARTSPLVGFCLVAFSSFLLTMLASAPLAARVIASWRVKSEPGDAANQCDV